MTEEQKFKTSIPKDQWFISWKRLYAHLSGGKGLVQKDVIKEELEKFKPHLLKGFNAFKHMKNNVESTQSGWASLSDDKTVEKKKKRSGESNLIVLKLSNLIDLEEETCEKIFISYFENEFVGTADDVVELLTDTNRLEEFLDDIILYYIHEKSFLIKCWKIILTYVFDEKHVYHQTCKQFVDNQNPNTLYEFFVKQLHNVQEDIIPIDSHVNAEVHKMWVNQTLSSHVDIICCMIFCSTLKTSVGFKDVQSILSLCKSNSFGENCINYRFVKSTYTYDWKTYIGYTYCLHLVQVILDVNFDWSFSEFNEIFEMIKTLDQEQNYVLVPVVYLVWMLFLVRINYINDEDKLIKYSQEILQRKPFKNLHLILESDIVTTDEIFGKVVKTKVKSLLCETIQYLDVAVLDHECEDVFKLIADLSSCTNSEDVNFDEEFSKIVQYGLDMFPGKYAAVLNAYIPLMSQSKPNCTKLLESLLSTKYFNWKSVDIPMENRENTFLSGVNFCPFEFVQDVIIPKGTECRQSDSGFDYFQWSINVYVWNIIQEELSAYCVVLTNPSNDELVENTSHLCNSVHGKVPHQKYLLPSVEEIQGSSNTAFRNRVISYLKLISVVVKYPQLLDKSIADILGIVSKIFELNVSLNSMSHEPDLEIVLQCVKIATNMYPGVTILYNQVENIFPTILPTPDVLNAYEILSTGRFLKGNFLKRMVTNVEISKTKYDFVMTYLQFISKLSEFDHAIDKSAYMSGILFIALELLPACLNTWIFQHEKQRREICSLCLALMYDFLNSFNQIKNDSYSIDSMKLPSYSTIVKSLVYSVLEGECGLLLFEVTSLGESFLLNSFQETPSSTKTFPKLIDMVYYSIAILNKVFYLKHELKEFEKLRQCSLESHMFREQDKNRFIRNIISYFHHVLNKNLRILSVKLLARIAENKEISLTIGSGLNSEIARSLWLQPLFSQTESPQFKIALFQFAVQCLQTQATLACSLLNIENLDQKSNSLLQCVLDYLKLVNDVNDPLYYWILAVIHTVWRKEMFIARDVLTSDKQFWKCLCAPLNEAPSSVNNNVYSPVFNIISTELFWMHDEKEHPLFDFVDKFFQNETNLKLWSKMSTNIELSRDKNFGLFHHLSISWQEFIVVICKFRNKVCSKKVRNIIVLDVLDAMVEHLDCITDDANLKKYFHCLCNLGLIVLNYWSNDCVDNLEEKLYIACNIVILLALKYEQVSLRTQIILLSVVSKLFNIIFDLPNEKLSTLVQENTMFLKSLSLVLIHSLDIYENILCKKDVNNQTTQLVSVIIPLTIKIQTIVSKDNLFWINTLLSENIIFKIYQCILECIKMKYYNTSSSFLLEYLIHCVLGNNYFKYLDKSTLVSIIEELTPEPNIDINDKNYIYLKNSNINYIYTNDEYNLFYNKFINLLMVLFHKGDVALKAQVFNFIIINYESIICLFKYCGLSLIKNNLNLVLSILNLLLEVTNHRILVQENTKPYFVQIVQNLSICIGTTINLIENDELKIAHTIYPEEAFVEGLNSKVYNFKFKTEEAKKDYSNELRVLLLDIYKTCLAIFNKFNVEFGTVLTCVRIGYEPWCSHYVVPYVPIEKKMEVNIVPFRDFTIILKCLKVHNKLIPKYNSNELIISNLKTSFEMTLHLLINHSLMYLLHPHINIKDKHVLLRDIEVNLSHVIDYVKKNSGVTIFPLTKHWSKSPSKYYNYSKMKIPHIKLKREKLNNVLVWDNKGKSRSVKRIVFDSDDENDVESHEIQFDMEYMQFMVQLFSQICSLASSTI